MHDKTAISGKKILFIIPSFQVGGAEKQASYLAAYYKEQGAKVSILAIDGKEGPLLNTLSTKGINCLSEYLDIYFLTHFRSILPTPSNLKFLKGFFSVKKKIERIFNIVRPGLVLPFCYGPNLVACNFYSKKKSSSIWNQRDVGIPPFNHSFFEKRAFKRASAVVSNSMPGARYIEDNAYADLNKITIIPNAVSIESEKIKAFDFRKKTGIPEKNVLITMVANFSTNKDQLTVIKAINILIKKNIENITLLLVGRFDGEEKKATLLIEQFKIESYVKLMPFYDHTADVYNATDIAVHSSLSEGMPNSLLEAMAHKLPVAASAIEGHTALLGRSYSLLFEPQNADQLANALSVLIKNKEMRLQTGIENAEKIKRSSVESTAKAFLDTITTF